MNTIHTPRFRQIFRFHTVFPAQPDTFALFDWSYDNGANTALLAHEPVVAWADADRWTVPVESIYSDSNPPPDMKPDRGLVPLVLRGGRGKPVDTEEEGFVGIRTGRYIHAPQNSGWAAEDAHGLDIIWNRAEARWTRRPTDREREQQRESLRRQFLFVMHEEAGRMDIPVGTNLGPLLDRLVLLAVPGPDSTGQEGAARHG